MKPKRVSNISPFNVSSLPGQSRETEYDDAVDIIFQPRSQALSGAGAREMKEPGNEVDNFLGSGQTESASLSNFCFVKHSRTGNALEFLNFSNTNLPILRHSWEIHIGPTWVIL